MYTDIKTFEDACAALNIDPLALPQVEGLYEKHKKATIAGYKLFVIVEALNEGWTPDWNDGTPKYEPMMDMETYDNTPVGSGGFSFHGCYYVNSCSFVGSRLCFKSSELAEYAVTQFEDIYRDVYLIEQ